jgi:hypothetical protein
MGLSFCSAVYSTQRGVSKGTAKSCHVFISRFFDKGFQACPAPYILLVLMTKIKIISQPLAVKRLYSLSDKPMNQGVFKIILDIVRNFNHSLWIQKVIDDLPVLGL